MSNQLWGCATVKFFIQEQPGVNRWKQVRLSKGENQPHWLLYSNTSPSIADSREPARSLLSWFTLLAFDEVWTYPDSFLFVQDSWFTYNDVVLTSPNRSTACSLSGMFFNLLTNSFANSYQDLNLIIWSRMETHTEAYFTDYTITKTQWILDLTGRSINYGSL